MPVPLFIVPKMLRYSVRERCIVHKSQSTIYVAPIPLANTMEDFHKYE